MHRVAFAEDALSDGSDRRTGVEGGEGTLRATARRRGSSETERSVHEYEEDELSDDFDAY